MKIAFGITATLLAVALVAIAAQEYRYFETRRDVVADRQAIFHSPSAFHVATLLKLSAEQELLSAVGSFADASEGAGGHVVYAGKIFQSGSSRQVADEGFCRGENSAPFDDRVVAHVVSFAKAVSNTSRMNVMSASVKHIGGLTRSTFPK